MREHQRAQLVRSPLIRAPKRGSSDQGLVFKIFHLVVFVVSVALVSVPRNAGICSPDSRKLSELCLLHRYS